MVLDVFCLLFGVCGVIAVAGFVLWAVIGLIAAAEWVRDRLPRRVRLDYERYCAEQSIRSIRRQAIHDMLEAEHAHRYAYDPDIIEGTAVEVKR